MFSENFLKNFDWVLFAAICCLVAVGLMTLWSLSPEHFFWRQVVWVLFGALLLFLFAGLDYRIFRNHSGIVLGLLAGGTLLLFLLIFFGPITRGVASWFHIGSAAFQPTELMKLFLIIILAKFFSARHVAIYQIRHLFVSGLYMIFPTLLVVAQPDLGSAFILIMLWVSLASFSGIRARHFAGLFFIGLVLAVLSWIFILQPYQKERIFGFLDPWRDPQGAGYNIIQAVTAVGSGSILGKGIGYGTQSHLNFLPEAETDFIFAAFAEETGFLGSILLLGFFAFFLWRIIRIGGEAEDNFSKLFALGFSALVFFQFLVHVGANLGILPVTGVTLPFVSYGGSSVVTLMIGVGILESIRIHSRSDIMDLA